MTLEWRRVVCVRGITQHFWKTSILSIFVHLLQIKVLKHQKQLPEPKLSLMCLKRSLIQVSLTILASGFTMFSESVIQPTRPRSAHGRNQSDSAR